MSWIISSKDKKVVLPALNPNDVHELQEPRELRGLETELLSHPEDDLDGAISRVLKHLKSS